MNDSDSAALVQKIAGGDSSAIMTLFENTSRLLFGKVLRILPDSSGAEEALLEAYTQIWRQASTYDPRGGTPLAWMMAIARTCANERMQAETPEQRKTGLPKSALPTGDEEQQSVRAATEAGPPEYLRDLLALRIEREPRAAPRQVEPAKLELKHASPPRPSPPARPRSTLVPWLVAVACAVAAALFLFLWRQTQSRSDQAIRWEKDAAAGARAEVDRIRSMMDSAQLRKQEIDVVDAALATPGAAVIPLAGRKPDVPAAAAVFWDTKKNGWIVIAHLPPAPSGKEYQLWFVAAERRRSAGLIPVDVSGRGFAVIDLPPDLPKITSVEITLEPAGGSEQPTSAVVASGRAG